MSKQSILVLMVDGLRASALGAWGNSSYPTPALDQLASESLVFDQMLADSTDLAVVYQSMFSGTHALLHASAADEGNLPQRFSAAGYSCHLVTDEPLLQHQPLVSSFGELTLVDTTVTQSAMEPAETTLGQVFAEALEVWNRHHSTSSEPFLLWAHLRGFYAPWDAPPELAQQLLDDDDPPFEPSIEVPMLEWDDVLEAGDEIFHAACRYAGQTMAFDHALADFQTVLAELVPQEPALVFGGARGFALGEHGRVGLPVAQSPAVHVPLMIRTPDRQNALQRTDALHQSCDLYDVLASLAAGDDPAPARSSLAVSLAPDSRMFRSSEWCFVEKREPTGDDRPRLFIKPDDVWEANDVASLCPAVVDQFGELAVEIDARVGRNEAFRDLSIDDEDDG